MVKNKDKTQKFYEALQKSSQEAKKARRTSFSG